jgi:hypothetical protein
MVVDHRRLSGAAPDRSVEQRREALERANWIRSRRKDLKGDLKAGRRPVVEVLLDPPEYALAMRLYELLLAVPKYGKVKVNQTLSRCRISPSKTLGGLSERQRLELAAVVRRTRGGVSWRRER